MSTENEYLAKTESLQKELEPVCRVITETVKAEAIYLFGSRAYGIPTDDSDYDLCVIIPENSMRPADAVKAMLVSGVHDPVLSGATNRFLSENRKPIDRIS